MHVILNAVFSRLFARIFVAAALLCALALPAAAREVIHSFVSHVTLRVDGSVDVTETIVVNAEGITIRRGIYRDIPTILVDPEGKKLRSNLEVISVKRDGATEPFFTEGITNGMRIYVGDADVFLNHGTYTYELRYTMTRMARQFDTYDELYWNATGNFWDFPIEKSTATLVLPEGAIIKNVAGYTGAFGSQESEVVATRNSDNSVTFRATRAFYPYEGMSVAVGFQKGILATPEGAEKAIYFLSDYREIILPGIAVFVVFLYYFFAWVSVGRDPKKGTIIPLFYPPKDVSPALTHYVWAYGWKKSGWQAFTSALFSLGAKGCLKIGEEGKKTTLEYLSGSGISAKDLPAGEAVLYEYLRSTKKVTINKSTGPTINTKKTAFQSAITKENSQVYFSHNALYVVLGIALSVICLIVLLVADVLPMELFIFGAAGGGALAAFAVIMKSIWSGGGILRIFQVGLLGLFLSNFLVWIGSGFESFPSIPINAAALATASIICANLIFGILMRAPTVQGRRIMDQIDGFRMYLETAEKERLNFEKEPVLTKDRFERILPYAIALGVEKPWAQRFEGELLRHAVPDAQEGYQPTWYPRHPHAEPNFSRDIASLASGMSAAMIAAQPASSSSSGSGGGGSSGGGGGGGGGGGW